MRPFDFLRRLFIFFVHGLLAASDHQNFTLQPRASKRPLEKMSKRACIRAFFKFVRVGRYLCEKQGASTRKIVIFTAGGIFGCKIFLRVLWYLGTKEYYSTVCQRVRDAGTTGTRYIEKNRFSNSNRLEKTPYDRGKKQRFFQNQPLCER